MTYMKLVKNITTTIAMVGLAAVVNGCEKQPVVVQEAANIVARDCRSFGSGPSVGTPEDLEKYGAVLISATYEKHNARGNLVEHVKTVNGQFIAETWDYDSKNGYVTRHRKCVDGELVLDEQICDAMNDHCQD